MLQASASCSPVGGPRGRLLAGSDLNVAQKCLLLLRVSYLSSFAGHFSGHLVFLVLCALPLYPGIPASCESSESADAWTLITLVFTEGTNLVFFFFF